MSQSFQNFIKLFLSIIACLEIFLTSLNGKMERERRVPLTATGTNPGSEYTLYLRSKSNFVNMSMTDKNLIFLQVTADLQYQISSRAAALK